MRLLLTSSGITNASIEKGLSDLLEIPYRKSSLAFIPTAANVTKEDKSWLVNDLNIFKNLGFSYFDIVDIAAVGIDIWWPSLKRADVLVFGGGDEEYLLTWIKKSGLGEKLPELLKTKVYVGISAGSMAAAKQVSLSSAGLLYYEDTGKFVDWKGLGFVDFEVRPHLNSRWFPKVTLENLQKIAHKTSSPFYAIDDTSAIKVRDNNINVISEGTWKKFS